jgi:hypothetical protein
MVQLNAGSSNSFRAGTTVHAFIQNVANAAVILAVPRLLPAPGLDQNWRELDGRPTNGGYQVVGGGAVATVVIRL